METQLKQALLVMDLQSTVMDRIRDSEKLLNIIAPVIKSARSAGIPVIYVIIAFRKGYQEINPNNKRFAHIPSTGANYELENTKIADQVAPQPGEVIVVKKRVSAFTGSDLEVVLRSLGVQHLVLTGFATSGVILSTVREASDKDYRLTVLSDACQDTEDEVHDFLIKRVLPSQADITTSQEWASAVEGQAKQ